MSAIAFLGPSLRRAEASALAGPTVSLRPPAVAGDVVRVLASGATAIGLVDGVFGAVPAVRHGEILLALACGVPVLGGASMGALRAAELGTCGMLGVGEVFRGYADGRLTADADVALIHGPEETGWQPLSEPLVDMLATLDGAVAASILTPPDAASLQALARATFYPQRTWPALADALPAADRARLLGWLPGGRRSVKAEDAAELLRRLQAPLSPPPPLVLPRTEALDRLVRDSVGTGAAEGLWQRARR